MSELLDKYLGSQHDRPYCLACGEVFAITYVPTIMVISCPECGHWMMQQQFAIRDLNRNEVSQILNTPSNLEQLRIAQEQLKRKYFG